MRYNSKLRFLTPFIGLVLLLNFAHGNPKTSSSNQLSNETNVGCKENFKQKLSEILNRGKKPDNHGKNPFDTFFGMLLNAEDLKYFDPENPASENNSSIPVTSTPSPKAKREAVSDVNASNLRKPCKPEQSKSQMFDWGTHTKVSHSLARDKLTPRDSQNQITQTFLDFFSVIKKGGNEISKKKSYGPTFKEIVVPSLIKGVNNSELEGATRGILINELLVETEMGKATIPKNRPDGLPSISFIGIENEVMPLHVIYIKEDDRFSFKTFPNFVPPDIPKIAGQRLKEWVILKYKQIHDFLMAKSREDLDSKSLLKSLNNYGIYFAIEFKDDAVCYLSEVTRSNSNLIKNSNSNDKTLVSRVSRILFSRLRPFISFQSTFIPLKMSEFRSLSFIGSPVLMNRADNEDDLLTQQALFYWSIEAEKFLNDYKRKDHVCNEREIFSNSEYKQHCMISPHGKNPRNPNSYNNGFITTVSCFGLHPEGTIVLFSYKSLFSLRVCQKDGSWSDIKVLSDQNRATVIFHKCHSRNNNKESFYSRVSTASFFED
ncbi:hypothetical protein [Cryptosporidium parvum Iowa II]|uniref:Uncharacterized protein n=2 Tax=Cryptosporidium parvum TaxID=5807 RepID=Q5CYI2_CRYPI|nr:hypothetical protein [Cryptosporidium parvum Iowa II]EAK90254.1 hypothetical protein, signal peptide, possible secreted protein [Cryptosporidium parvum Iowa II]QOY40541.1 Uncharacterized protein CPATCC_0008030 [Cryptosporidium parvum]WKS78912.1 putative signal peptide-containing protein [Cryptosporidium sp. 43IA8]WRK33395.1 Uncharacterized protein cpbgf_7002240 [Cryptosporidium parvum]|eukprot:QOY40541.1 hypothetical protein CPATCC_003404 [Cryptosporidium parvum]